MELFREAQLVDGRKVKVPINKAIIIKNKPRLNQDCLLENMLKASHQVDYNKINERLRNTWEEVFYQVNLERLNFMATKNNKDLKKYLI